MGEFHEFITSSDEFYLYLTFQAAMFSAAFTIGWLSAWIWFLKKAGTELERKPSPEDWSM